MLQTRDRQQVLLRVLVIGLLPVTLIEVVTRNLAHKRGVQGFTKLGCQRGLAARFGAGGDENLSHYFGQYGQYIKATNNTATLAAVLLLLRRQHLTPSPFLIVEFIMPRLKALEVVVSAAIEPPQQVCAEKSEQDANVSASQCPPLPL